MYYECVPTNLLYSWSDHFSCRALWRRDTKNLSEMDSMMHKNCSPFYWMLFTKSDTSIPRMIVVFPSHSIVLGSQSSGRQTSSPTRGRPESTRSCRMFFSFMVTAQCSLNVSQGHCWRVLAWLFESKRFSDRWTIHWSIQIENEMSTMQESSYIDSPDIESTLIILGIGHLRSIYFTIRSIAETNSRRHHCNL